VVECFGVDAFVETAPDMRVDRALGLCADRESEFYEAFRFIVERAGLRAGLAQSRILLPDFGLFVGESSGSRREFVTVVNSI